MSEDVKSQAAVPGTQFQEVHLVVVLPLVGQIAEEGKDQLGVGFAHHRIAGKVMWHCASSPGSHPCLLVIVAVELPDQTLGKGPGDLDFVAVVLHVISKSLAS